MIQDFFVALAEAEKMFCCYLYRAYFRIYL